MCPVTPRRRKGPTPATIAAIVAAAALAIAGVMIFALERDDTNPASPATTGSVTTTATRPQEGTQLRVYLVRDGGIATTTRSAMATPAVGRAAVTELLSGVTADEQAAGLTTDIPDGTQLEALTIAGGHATVKLSSDLSSRGQAQVVFTLTQFPSVRDVVVETPAGTSRTLDRAALESLSPIILVEQPTPGQTVTSPLTVSGTSNTFEATL